MKDSESPTYEYIVTSRDKHEMSSDTPKPKANSVIAAQFPLQSRVPGANPVDQMIIAAQSIGDKFNHDKHSTV